MGLFSNAGIVGDELQRCLAYYEAVMKVTDFQTREADLFNNTLVKYLDSMAEDQVAARQVCDAANRLVQCAQEVIRRHEEISSIPQAVYSMRYAWRWTLLAYATWAEATLSAMEALANGMTPHYAYVQDLLAKYHAAYGKAQKEDKKFLKRLQVTPDAFEKIINRCNDAGETDNWQPKPSGYDFGKVGKTLV